MKKRTEKLKRMAMIVSILLGLEIEATFYMVFGINPRNIPLFMIVGFWAICTVLVGCITDEFLKRKFHIRIY